MSAISNLIGQDHAKRVMSRAAWRIREKPSEIADSYCFIGPPSAGKTVCARALAAEAGLPLLELQPQAISKANDLITEILTMVLPDAAIDEYGRTGIPPRIAIFIDEIHQISRSMEQALLKALEPGDRLLVSEDGRELDTSRFVFLFATTDRGDLFDALDTRTVKISLNLYSREQIAKIVQANFNWNHEACKLVSHYCGTIPREALQFARDMQTEAEMTGSRDYREIAEIVAKDHSIDEYGMTKARLDILTALGQAPVSRGRIRHICGVKDAELQKFILPPLVSVTPDQTEPLLTVSNKGYTITPAGLAELNKREIPNQGIDAIPKQVRSLFNFPEVEKEASKPRTLGDINRASYFKRSL